MTEALHHGLPLFAQDEVDESTRVVLLAGSLDYSYRMVKNTAEHSATHIGCARMGLFGIITHLFRPGVRDRRLK